MVKLSYMADRPMEVEMEVEYEYEDGHPYATHVHLVDPVTGDGLATGTAICHTSDQFNRKAGRKLAFQRATEAFTYGMNPTVAYRVKTALWNDFLKQVRI